MPGKIYLKQLELGPMQNFVYIVADPETREAAVIDPAWEIQGIIDLLQKEDLKLKAALITHFHPDHLGGDMMGHHIDGSAELLKQNLPVKIYIHKSEAELACRISGLSMSDMELTESSDKFQLGQLSIEFIHTPGHTPGSQCFLVDGQLISGDTLFIGSCGRIDLPGSDASQLYDSLNNKLKKLPDETMLFPGHNYSDRPSSTIAMEKAHNPYMRFERLQDFLSVMGY